MCDLGSVLFRELAGGAGVSRALGFIVRNKDSLCVLIHDDGHTVHIESVRLWHHTLAESVGDVVAAEEGGEHDEEVDRDNGEDGGVPLG